MSDQMTEPAAESQSEAGLGEMPVPDALLLRLLDKMSISCSHERVRTACAAQPESSAAREHVASLQAALVLAEVRDVHVIRLPWARLNQRHLPALVWYQQQWYIAEREAPGEIRLQDASGESTVCADEMLSDALVLLLKQRAQPNEAHSEEESHPAARLVWRELMRERGWMTNVVVATLVINLLAISTSLFAMQVYDRVVPTLAYATLSTLVAGMALILVLDWVLKILRARILDSAASAVDKRVSRHVFDHLMHIQLDQQPKSLGTLAAQVAGLDSVRQFFSASVVFALVDLPFAVLFIGLIATIGGVVSVVYILLLPAALLLGAIAQIRLRRLLREQIQRTNERQGLLVDAIRGAESIRASNAAWRFSEYWQRITDSIASYNIQHKAISSFSSVTTSSLSTLAYVSAVVVGVSQIESGSLTMGGLIACSILGGRVIAPVAQSVAYMAQWQSVSQSLQMVDQLLKLRRERRVGQALLFPDGLTPSLEAEQVRFSYADSPVQQLRMDSLSIAAGERVMLLGPVGCGKSTLLKVLAGLYRPAEGRIKLGGCDLWELDPQHVASHMAYLPQAVHLFKGTLKSNLTLSGSVSDSRLLAVTQQLGIDTVAAAHPLGMELPIAEGGEGLSGGQRQLVAMGRLMASQPRIWLLDEPTASLDNESETRVLQTLESQLRPDDILVVSTHRPMAFSRLAKRVVVMQQGQVVKDGSLEEVLPQLMVQRSRGAAATTTMRKGVPGVSDVI